MTIIKRLINVLLTISIISASYTFALAAEQSAAEAETITAEDGICDTLGVESYSSDIVINSSNISVATHPFNADYYISSDTLLENLSVRRYTLSYVNDNGEETQTDNVTDGYVRAVHQKDSTNMKYIPIVMYKDGEKSVLLGDGMYFSSGGGCSLTYKKGTYGRGMGTTMTVITPPETGNTAYDRVEYSTPLSTVTKTHTAEFYMYADGDSEPRLNYKYGDDNYKIFTWRNSGVFEVNENGTISETTTLEREKWHKMAITFDVLTNKILVYADGKLQSSAITPLVTPNHFRFGIDTDCTSGSAVYSDLKYYYGYYYPEYYTEKFDISDSVIIEQTEDGKLKASLICDETSKERKLCVAQYASDGTLQGISVSEADGADNTAEIEFDYNARVKTKIFTFDEWGTLTPSETVRKIGSMTMLDEDFEDYNHSMNEAANGNILEVYEEADGNHAMQLKRVDGNSSDFHIGRSCDFSYSDYAVYDLDLKINDINSSTRIYLQGGSAGNKFADLSAGGKLKLGSKTVTLEADRWYNIAAEYNYYDRAVSFYLDGELIDENNVMTSGFCVNDKNAIFRCHPNANSESLDILIDNMRAYEGAYRMDSINVFEKIVDTDESKSVFASETAYKNMLDGYVSIHSRSGVVYSDGEKTLLTNAPYTEDGEAYVNAEEICAILETSVPDGVNESGYISITDLAAALGKTLYSDTTAINSGMYIMGDSKFSAPTGSTLQELNDFTFYFRPNKADLAKAYNASPQKGVHPRIQATEADFDRVRGLYESRSNEYFNVWADYLINGTYWDNGANGLLEDEDSYVTYTVSDGRLLSESRRMITNMYTLGMAYQLTGEQKYVDRAWIDLLAVSQFDNWHPSHHLDPCEMALGVAIGYDWMYHALTPEQRQIIEEGMYKNLFYDAALSYKSELSQMTNSATATNNHNIVCNGGIAVGAMAMLDVYPEEAYYLLKNAIRASDLMLYHYAPYGAWYEGVGYWELTTQYTVAMLSTMDTVLGNMFSLDKCEGLNTASRFMVYMQTGNGIFNSGDNGVSWLTNNLYVPEMIWMANKYNDPVITKAVLKYRGSQLKSTEDTALGLLWYDGTAEDTEIDLPLDALYDGDASMRNTWEYDETASALYIHGGETCREHSQIDGGSFIFETQGERWAMDPGMGDYNSVGYWEMNPGASYNRWQYFRSRAESHNTVVINPDTSKPDHYLYSSVDITRFETDDDEGIAVADMSGALSENATSAKRGWFYTDNRESLVIRDEISLKDTSEVHWHMMTLADITIDGDKAILSLNGEKVVLEYIVEGGTAEISYMIEEEAAEPYRYDGQFGTAYGDTINRIKIKFDGTGDVSITVKLTPYNMEGGTSVENYNTAIDSWTLNN